jgi:arginine exporter protein ArgO
MKSISIWAYCNPFKSQLIIAVCQLTLTVLAVYGGIWLFARGVELPGVMYYTGLTLFFLALVLYPVRRARFRFWKMNYARQKTIDAVLLVSYLLAAVSISNFDAHSAWLEASAGTSAFAQPRPTSLADPAAVHYNAAPEKPWSRRELKRALRQQYKQFVSEKRRQSDDGSTGLIVAIVVLMLALMVAVFFLSCSISCSGANVLGLVVLIGGWALILTLGILAIRNIVRKRRQRQVTG